MKHILHSLYFIVAMVLAAVMSAPSAHAFDTNVYATESALNTGRWVKISVAETGVHHISASTLRQWGFSDASKVRVHGYGGNRLADRLTRANYIDDLPEVATYRNASGGIYFYAEGPVSWSESSGRYIQSLNPFSTLGYYYLTQDADTQPKAIATEGQYNPQAQAVRDFDERLYHEQDLVTLSQSGLMLFGEDFRFTRTRTFNFTLTDMVPYTTAWLRCAFASSTNSTSQLLLTANGSALTGNSLMGSAGDNHGVRSIFTRTFSPQSEALSVGVTFNPSGAVAAANLDGLTINYRRYIRLHAGRLLFQASSTTVGLDGADSRTHVWDVTDAVTPVGMNITLSDATALWTNPYSSTRRYAAFSESASLPAPKYVGVVANQNLHGITITPEMVIVTVKDYAGEAERVANLHRRAPENMEVLVVTQDDIFNEFASGSRDPGAIRRFLKMLYDRGEEAGQPLRYALLFGRATFDNRQITTEMKALKEPFLATWQTDESLSEYNSYVTDDYFGILGDNSGYNIQYDRINLAVGRIPARSLSQAKQYVDKLYAYADNSLNSEWKNTILLEADNGNLGAFMDQSEDLYNNTIARPEGRNFVYNKVYIDAFTIQNGTCVGGRERFYRALDDGILWWSYVGHGAITTLCSENMLSRTDISNMYNKRWPVLFAGTCSFAHWDGPEVCGSEMLTFNPSGGVIATISTTRKAYVTDNGRIAAVLGNHLMQRDAQGNILRLGDMILNAKNSLLGTAAGSTALTKLRFSILGDPAMRLATPSNTITLETINGDEVTTDAQCTIMARQNVTLTGSVNDPSGRRIDDFNGQLSLTLYDAEYSTTSNGLPADDTEGRAVTFEEMGSKLYSGRGVVKDGEFTVTIPMPSEVADNFRPATLNMYAIAADGREATGVNRDFYVYGYDDTAAPDTQAPVIDYAYLNHESFTPGATVNTEPMFIASVTDDVAINLSMAGIGHQMSLKVDDRTSYNDVSLYYTPAADGTPSGTIAYPISELPEGNHTLTFRVWDTSGNSTTHTIPFFVEQGARPQLFDIYTDVNPATDHANFYVSHNRPDAMMTVTLDIYNMLGHRVWTSTAQGRSDMFTSAPIQWNLTDLAGRRVQRGIYIYRATVTHDGNTLTTAARRLAVTAP